MRSVQNQTFADLEMIVINDGSTDGSGEILERILREDKRIRLFHQENKGAGSEK